jgi:hypothetical protein
MTWPFVMTLSHSRHQYVELVQEQTVATWLSLHRNAFAFLGGVPRKVVLDNLKAGIVKASVTGPGGAARLPRVCRALRLRHLALRAAGGRAQGQNRARGEVPEAQLPRRPRLPLARRGQPALPRPQQGRQARRPTTGRLGDQPPSFLRPPLAAPLEPLLNGAAPERSR